MTNFRINKDNRIVSVDAPERRSWIDVIDPSREELALLEREYGINPEHLLDIMDIDELARIEKEEAYTLLIVRLPVHDPRNEISYFTVPFGILLFSDRIVTVCQQDCEVLEELRAGRVRQFDVGNKSTFVLHLLGRAAIVYLRYLKDINRRTASIERELQRSVKNHELTQLLALEKSLVFFTTSLKSNEIVLEKLQSSRAVRIKEDEVELLEDILTDNRQAIEMANIYSDILAGMMDAFASVISNNLNIQMKRLTNISVILMLSNLIVSAFSMNVDSPFSGKTYAFWMIIGISLVMSLAGALLIRGRVNGTLRITTPRTRQGQRGAARSSPYVAATASAMALPAARKR
jgi:magnesium transporter